MDIRIVIVIGIFLCLWVSNMTTDIFDYKKDMAKIEAEKQQNTIRKR